MSTVRDEILVSGGPPQLIGLFGALLLTACNLPEQSQIELPPEVSASQALVRASPPGGEFAGQTTVELLSMVPAAVEIFYTTDGSPATSEGALPYRGPIQLDGTTLLSFIAKGANGAWSVPGTELYVSKATPVGVKPVARAIRLTPSDVVFFAWRPGDPVPMEQVVRAVSVGTEAVHIDAVELGDNQNGQFYSDPSAFDVSVEGSALLYPGQAISIHVKYSPTETLRSAQITIRSNELQRDGRTSFELWGRISPY